MPTVLENRVGPAPPTATGHSLPVEQPARGATATDDEETLAIERDPDLYQRVTSRVANPGESVPAEDVLGPLGEDPE